MALQLYAPLPHDDSIRLLKFLPSYVPDLINASLEVYQLHSAPPYQAISYVWGDPGKTKEIICNGQPLKITVTLFNALQRVRRWSPNLLVWADAICISQQNSVERSHQVAMMGRIYERADTVLVHIPGTKQESSEVKALVEDIKHLIESSGGMKNMKHLSDDDPLLMDPRWKSMTLFKQKPWFYRAWVIQEVGMARDPRILLGDCEFSYRDWVLLESWALTYAPQLDPIWNLPMGTIHMAALDWFREDFPRKTNFIDLFSTTSSLECTDPRDHIYSLLAHPLSRLPGKNASIVNPDYTKPASDVYYDFSVQMLQLPEGLRLLSAVQHGENGPPIGYPSWVPFWYLVGHRTSEDFPFSTAFTMGVCHLHYYNASSGLGDSYHATTDEGALLLHGVLFDQLASVSQLKKEDFEISSKHSDTSGSEGILESIYSAVTDSSSLSPYGCNQNRRDAFSITLSAGFLSRTNGENMENLPFHQANFNAYWKARARARQSMHIEKDDAGDAMRFMVDLKEKAHHRSFFISRRGYVGLGPYFAQPGDLCVVFRGGFVPFIIRPGESDGKFRLIGECYVHGIMRGELASMVERESMAIEDIILH